jgi:hypothetical protein
MQPGRIVCGDAVAQGSKPEPNLEDIMRKTTAVVMASGVLFMQVPAGWADAVRVAQAPGTATQKAPGAPAEQKLPSRGESRTVKLHGTIEAIDKDKGTVTIKDARRALTFKVEDKAKLDMIKVGDPVVATYTEAIAFQVMKAGTGSPSMSVTEGRASSKPGETPAGAVGRAITVTTTITAIDKKAQTVTIKGPGGNSETVKARDPKNLDLVKVGDLVDITYAQALIVSLDKPPMKEPVDKTTKK